MKFEITCRSLKDTEQLGVFLAEQLPWGVGVGLCGPLGSGKTTLVRSLARSLGVREEIVSPTFVLEAQYEVSTPEGEKKCLHHWDLYRLSGEEFECELRDYLGDPGTLTLVEWPERVPWVADLLHIHIMIDFARSDSDEDLEQRRITLAATVPEKTALERTALGQAGPEGAESVRRAVGAVARQMAEEQKSE